MKNEFTSKINTLGRCGRIVSNIMRGVSLACAIVLLVCTFIVCFFIPAEDLKFNGIAQGVITYNTESTAFSIDGLESGHKSFFGAEFDAVVKETKDSTKNGFSNVDIEISAEKVTAKQVKIVFGAIGIGAVLLLSSMYIIFMFAAKLCKALEVCHSPFEEDVIKAVKKLGFAFIPFGIVSIILNGVSLLSTVMIVLVVLLFVYIFSYGAELQKESDDTV